MERDRRISGVLTLGAGLVILWALLFLGGQIKYVVSLIAVYVINVVLVLGEETDGKTKKRELAIGGTFVAVGLLLIVASGGALDKLGLIVGMVGLFLSNLGLNR